MDDKQLAKKFHDKKFLKQNEFVDVTAKIVGVIKEYKTFFILGVVAAFVLGIGIYGLKYYQLQQINTFNDKLYQAQKSLKKESLYRDLLKEYQNLPASQFVRIKLIDDLLDHSQIEEAKTVISDGLKGTNPSIFKTVLVLKNINLLKEQKQYKEAIDFANQSQSKILPTFSGRFKMIVADLHLLNKDKEGARKIYQMLSQAPVETDVSKMQQSNFDPSIISQAKERLLLLDLEVI